MRLAFVMAGLAAASMGCSAGEPAAPDIDLTAGDAPLVMISTAGMPLDVAELFQTRMMPTCARNSGVCHNSSTYPDLRHFAALEELVQMPCGRDVDAHLPDACEPIGDRVVSVGAGIDVGVVNVTIDADVATIHTDADVPRGSIVSARIRRSLAGGAFFPIEADGVPMESAGGRALTILLSGVSTRTRTFFEPTLPLRESRIWAADPNGNGVAGASLGIREIVPGHPEKSYLVARLWDDALNPELMPRQCREWSDSATQALACWIEGLRSDPSGGVTNFADPIDYRRCRFRVPRPGRCGP